MPDDIEKMEALDRRIEELIAEDSRLLSKARDVLADIRARAILRRAGVIVEDGHGE